MTIISVIIIWKLMFTPLFIDKYTQEDVRFEWRDVAPWRGIGLVSEHRNQFRLPKYVVTFVTDKSNHIRNFGEGKCISIALRFCLRFVSNICTLLTLTRCRYAACGCRRGCSKIKSTST